MNDQLKIGIFLPISFTFRDFLFTPVWDEMLKRENVIFYLLIYDVAIYEYLKLQTYPNIVPVRAWKGQSYQPSVWEQLFGDWLEKWGSVFEKWDNDYLNHALLQRFVAVNHLSHYFIRLQRSPEGQKLSQLFSNYLKGEKVGYPFPESKLPFYLLYAIRHGFPNISRRRSTSILQNLKLDLLVHGRLHWITTAEWALAARKMHLPMIGMISSWDHTTVQGPTPRGMSGYIVASQHMTDEMCELHGIQAEKIAQVGKVQMDYFLHPDTIVPREQFLNSLGIPAEHRLITFATNTTGLNEHEISIARQLADDINNHRYGKVTMLLRTHPHDTNREKNFLSLSNPPWVIGTTASSFNNIDNIASGKQDQILLANLMKHSDIVIQSRGSIALDAIAFDTPVISLAFDGNLQRLPQDSYLWEYAYEHYKPLVAAKGTWMVGSYTALERAIQSYFKDPSLHADGRKKIRAEHIEPLDGKASERLIDYLVDMAHKARDKSIPKGDWHLTGLGDTKWASRQKLDVQQYVDN